MSKKKELEQDVRLMRWNNPEGLLDDHVKDYK